MNSSLCSILLRANSRRLPCSYLVQQSKLISSHVNSPRLKQSELPPISVQSQSSSSSWLGEKMKSIYKTVSGGDRVSNKELRSAGFIMCTYCTNGTNIRDFIEYFDLPDTYFSWFLVTELHIWMISNRVMSMSNDRGEVIRDAMISALWHDCDSRLKNLAEMSSKDRKFVLNDLSQGFQVS